MSSSPPPARLSPWTKSVIAGSVSGMASVVACHPFDTIRTRLQLSPARFRGFFHCAQLTIQQETMRGLYKGFLPPFFSQGVYKAVIFTTSATLRNDVLPHVPLLQPVLTPTVVSLTAGAIAGGVNAFLVAPVELVRNRLQVQYDNQPETRRYRGAYHCVSQVVRTEGITAMWKGLTTTVIRDSLGVAFYFLGYDFAKQRLTTSRNLGETATLLTAGAFGGISFWAVALPFDTIKSLIQADGKTGKYTGLVSSTARLVREDGVMQLFRGWQAAFSRGIPSAALTFWTFERANKFLNEI
ncbi:Mitochondrial basic amino acids transporter [Phytophthora citrophthora]|uniref:Mitochondrial basic amino acids transporter n=1 Tax=Phytophthora citrophthora TaxID=4793 RepID=A0AAD9G919_9STRA|nr:Mitochondrial basic amino acids transporter [Phytophthora citrophthora]KAK1934091.1 Mitochondrial basic amino acids transporter [Phytophthora citrophthora]